MRKSLLLIVVTVALMSTVGCSSKDSGNETANVADKGQVVTEEEVKEEDTTETMEFGEETLVRGDIQGKRRLSDGMVIDMQPVGVTKFETQIIATKDGTEVWRYEKAANDSISFVTETEDDIVLHEDDKLVAVNKDTGKMSWENSDIADKIVVAVSSDNNIYMANINGGLIVVNKKGETIDKLEYFISEKEEYFRFNLNEKENVLEVYIRTFENKDESIGMVKVDYWLDLSKAEPIQ